ncbi:HEAT repeat domain-containing protein [candidate division WOR-3 bacterium]|nr:HEAT repeat domain-containing protein [candidate division WOR-3 bacterium]
MRQVSFLVLVLLGFVFGIGIKKVDSVDALFQNTLNQALEIQGMKKEELGFFKFWAVDSFFRLKIVDRLLSHPLEVAPYVESSAARIERLSKSPTGIIFEQYKAIDLGLSNADTVKIGYAIKRREKSKNYEEKDDRLSRAVNTILVSFEVADSFLKQAVAQIPERELNILLGEAPAFWKDEDDTLEKGFSGILHREFGKDYDTTIQVKSETLLAYARKIDRRSLALAGITITIGTTRAIELLKEMNTSQDTWRNSPTVFETRWGKVIIGTIGDDVYREDAALIIDPAGYDRYFNRAGGTVGILDKPFSIVIDLEGNDIYQTEKLFSQGASLFGCGLLFDIAGDDVYRSRHYTQGSTIFGTGVLWDVSGHDIYDAGFFAQGAGHYGVGLLIDNAGNDSYRCFCYGQGFAGTWGYGLLVEGSGQDLYYSGGRYLHEPLLPREYRSFAQGFAIGVRPDASGGIGFLCDFKGNDFYNAEVFGQGTSYWYSLGMLYDREGFDHYTAAQYSQGAGIHLSIGALIDEEGNDSYFSRLGPSQGEGHDLSVGVLFDRKGDDGYYASGGQGIGLTNSVGLFLDADGQDWYMTSESLIAQGSSNWARGFGGIGVFLDFAGKDQYPAKNIAENQSSWTKGTYGSGIDLDRPATVIDYEPNVDTSEASIDSVITAPVESVFKTASIWAVGNARKKVLRARKELIRLGGKAMEYIYNHKLDTKDGLESEAVLALVKALPDTAKPYLLKGLRDERFLARQNSAYWLGEMGKSARDVVDSILLALKEGRITPRRGVYALGSIGDSTVVPQILYLLKDTFELSRIVTAEACGKLKNPVVIPSLIEALSDRFFTVRSAAEASLVSLGVVSLDSILSYLDRLSPPALGHGIRAAGQIVSKHDTLLDEEVKNRCRQKITGYLRHYDPFVRLCTVATLAQMLDDDVRTALSAARAEEKNPFLISFYRRLFGE